jgi:hypothetical protein
MRVLWCVLLLCGATCFAAEPIPTELVGVWATDIAKMRGYALFEGQAIYLKSDGSGALIGGPPPIGFKITAAFDPATSELEITAHEGQQRAIVGKLKYDPNSKTLSWPTDAPLHRRYSEITDEMMKSMGL